MDSSSKDWWWSRDLIPNIFLVDNFLPEDIFYNLSEEVKNALVRVREEGIETIKKSNQKLASS